ncbi:MAG: hypothetical protein ABIS29_11580 [Vicinamibacterales bacterium]
MSPTSCDSTRLFRTLLVALTLVITAGSALAQSKPVTVIAGVDFPTVYFFRGIRQEADPKFTTFVFGDVGFALLSDGSGGVKSAGINVGTWNAFMTGSSGSNGIEDNAFYESDVYAGLTLGFQNGVSVTPMFTAYTSPNDLFKTVKEISFKVAHASKVAPYALVAFEIGGSDSGQADGGSELGTYLELGVGPSWPIAGGKATIAVPVKLGLSLKDYYELRTGTNSFEDKKFGYIVGGALVTVPLSGGKWNVHGGVDIYGLGDLTGAANADPDTGEPRKGWVIASGGVGFTF